jgi:hypothetical protein
MLLTDFPPFQHSLFTVAQLYSLRYVDYRYGKLLATHRRGILSLTCQ